jgi:hypothetical protein
MAKKAREVSKQETTRTNELIEDIRFLEGRIENYKAMLAKQLTIINTYRMLIDNMLDDIERG